MAHPPNAVYFSDDGLVSYDAWGRRLDSNGNVAIDRGGGGGGQPPSDFNPKPDTRKDAGNPNPDPAAPTAPPVPVYADLPGSYLAGFQSIFGDPVAYYKDRGAETQAKTDYYNILNTWQNKTGMPLADDSWSRVWSGLKAYNTGYAPTNAATPTMSNVFNSLGRMLTSAPRAPGISYLRTGEI